MREENPQGDVTYWDLIQRAFDDVDIYGRPRTFLRHFRALPEPVRHLLAAHWCQSEVNNGGFDQFFLNSTGVLAPEAAAGFRALGLAEAAKLLEEAMSAFGWRYPRKQSARQRRWKRLPRTGAAFNGLGRAFGHLDDPFYEAMERAGGFESVADRYAKGHAGDTQ